mmetsp:Transcript_549/g.1305  ORF Transcript_549/g.1305 Transcript_549/m.1305 type:complete len:286 (-) Transcript_549:149-1006(-)
MNLCAEVTATFFAIYIGTIGDRMWFTFTIRQRSEPSSLSKSTMRFTPITISVVGGSSSARWTARLTIKYPDESDNSLACEIDVRARSDNIGGLDSDLITFVIDFPKGPSSSRLPSKVTRSVRPKLILLYSFTRVESTSNSISFFDEVFTIPAERIAGTSLPYSPCLNDPVQTNTSVDELDPVEADLSPSTNDWFIHSESPEAFFISFSDLLSGCHIASFSVVLRPKFASRATATGAIGVCSGEVLEVAFPLPLSSNVLHKATHRSLGSLSIPGGGFTTGRIECSC